MPAPDIFDEPKIDCHCHVLDPIRFPFGSDTRYHPAGQEIAPTDSLIRTMDIHGVRHALIVGTNSGYGRDLSPVADALAHGDGRFKAIAVVANDIGTDALTRLKAAGFVGVAFNVPFHGTGYYAGAADLLERLSDLNMILQIQAQDTQWLELLPLIERSAVRLVIDHCGRPSPALGLGQPGFQAVLALGRAGRASIKLSGLGQFSRQRYPYTDTHAFIRALIEAFSPARCMWGSDWPFLRAPERIDYGPLLQLLATLVPDQAARASILWDTPRRLLGFGS